MGRGLHLALNSGHDGWFPDVIHWNCAAPSRRLMKTHASSGASQMIPGPSPLSRAHVLRVVAFGSVPLYTLMAFTFRLDLDRSLKIQGFRRTSRFNDSLLTFLSLSLSREENVKKNCADFYGYFVLQGRDIIS